MAFWGGGRGVTHTLDLPKNMLCTRNIISRDAEGKGGHKLTNGVITWSASLIILELYGILLLELFTDWGENVRR